MGVFLCSMVRSASRQVQKVVQVVAFNFAIEGGAIHSQKASGFGLVAPSPFKDRLDFVLLPFEFKGWWCGRVGGEFSLGHRCLGFYGQWLDFLGEEIQG